MSKFAENMKRIRFEYHMTQEEFAELLGTKKQNISRYESGAVSPKISTAAKIASQLGVSLSVLNGDNPQQDNDAIWQKRESLRRDPKRRVLFDLAENGTEKDIDAAVALLDALKATNPDFYDGDDPA